MLFLKTSNNFKTLKFKILKRFRNTAPSSVSIKHWKKWDSFVLRKTIYVKLLSEQAELIP